MPERRRSLRQEQLLLSTSLREKHLSWAQVADVFRQRYGVSARVGLRLAHGWSQRQAADRWNERWPAEPKTARKGELLTAATPVATKIQSQIASFAPTNLAGEALDSETFRQFDNFIDNRNQRLNQMTTSLPGTLWLVLIAGAIINLALIAMLGMNKLSAHLTLSGLYAVFLSLMLHKGRGPTSS